MGPKKKQSQSHEQVMRFQGTFYVYTTFVALNSCRILEPLQIEMKKGCFNLEATHVGKVLLTT